MKKTLKMLLSSMAAMLVVVSAYAQITTSSMAGKVNDEKGEALAGATVIATHTPSGTTYYSVVGSNGRYSIQGMRPGGPYEVSISLLGFETVKVSDITLTLGATSPVSATLKESAELLAEAVVYGEGGIDATKTGAAQSIGGRQIQEMPSITRGVADVARLNPFVRVGSSGDISFAGTNNKYNSFQIDGAMNNDVFGLTPSGSNGGQAGTQPVSMETVDQLQINVAPFDVRQSGFTGGSINAITKSGTNEFHGSVYGYGNNQILYGRFNKANGDLSPKYSQQYQYQAGATVSGPIIKDKLFFFANFERSDNSNPNVFGLGSSSSAIDASLAEAILNKVKTAPGSTYSGNLPTDLQNYTQSNKATAKIDWNINKNNHFSFRWSLVDAKQLNSTSTEKYLNSTDYSYDFVSRTNSFVAELQSKISDNQNNELRVSYVRVRDKRNPLGDPFPMLQISNVGGGTLCIGNERSSEKNRLDQDIISITDNYTWDLGSHSVTAGTHNEIYTFTNLFIQDAYGTYYFDSVDDFNSGTFSRYRYNKVNEALTGTPNWEPTFHAAQFGIYAQDKWSISDNFDLTYGLRIDLPVFFDAPTENVDFTNSALAKSMGLRTNQMPKARPLFSPRAGFRWNVIEGNKLIVRGGAGLFTGRIPFVWFSNNFSNTGVQIIAVDTRNKTQLNQMSVIYNPDGQNANAAAIGAAAPTPGAQTINVIDPNFKIAQNFRADLGIDFKALGIDWTVEGVFSKNINDVLYKQLSRELDGGKVSSIDPRPTYRKCGEFNNIYYLTNTNKGYSYNLMAQASKSFKFGLDVAASYTYTKALSAFNGTSSVAQSNWAYNYTHTDSNDPELANSAFNIPHQFKVNVSYHKSYGRNDRWTTTAGAVLVGTSGMAYSVYYNGDLNGDSSDGNDLIFIPTDAQIDQMTFKSDSKYTPAQQAANLKQWLGNAQYLKDHRGEYFDRYADNLPFETHIDIHLAQRFAFNVGNQKHAVELSFDIINFANMLSPNWGRSYGLGINGYYSPITYKGNGEYQFLQPGTYNMFSYNDLASRWRGQIGIRYIF